MGNEQYTTQITKIANDIENLRLKIYSDKTLNIYNAEDKVKIDDILFSIQSKLRYEVNPILACYEE